MGIKNNGVLKEVVTNKETYETKAIIIATGAKNRSLKLDKEKNLLVQVFHIVQLAMVCFLEAEMLQ